jgi:hypothetical protein
LGANCDVWTCAERYLQALDGRALVAAGTAPEEITIEEAEEVMREPGRRRRAEWIGQDPDS